MKISKKWKWAAAVAIFMVVAAGWRAQRGGKRSSHDMGAVEPPTVSVRTVQRGALSQRVWVTGEVRALQCVEITSKTSGWLQRLRLDDGTPIDEGVEIQADAVVAVIEHDQLAAAVRTAEAALQVARAALETAQVNAEDASRERKRWTGLRQDGAATQQQLDQAVTADERAQAQLEQARAQVAQAEAALAQAQVSLSDATILAPFSGVVTQKHVDEGAYVGPGTPLFRLANIASVEIVGSVAEFHFPAIRVGETKATIEVDAYPGEIFEGVVSRLCPAMDRLTRTVAVTIRVPNTDRKLKPGMFARLNLLLQHHTDIAIVPDAALIEKEGRTQVFAVVNGIATLREVQTGLREGHLVEIEGVQPGEQVVVRGLSLLRDGQAVVPVELEEGR